VGDIRSIWRKKEMESTSWCVRTNHDASRLNSDGVKVG